MTIDQVTGTPNSNGDSLKDSWMLFPCYAQQGQDCITAVGACPNQLAQNPSLTFEQQGLQIEQTFTLGGTSGVMYNLTFQINGITEAKYYEMGTRARREPQSAEPGLADRDQHAVHRRRSGELRELQHLQAHRARY